MKGLEKLTVVRLAETLTQNGTVSAEVITDALYSQDKHGEPFVQALLSGGHISEWDLAKLVTENFQLPFLMASSYQIPDAAKVRFPKELLFQHRIIPLDVWDKVVCITMPVMTPYDVLAKIQKDFDCDVFPYVGLASENKKVLAELFPDFLPWLQMEEKRLESEQTRRAEAAAGRSQSAAGGRGDGWMSIFDAGDMAIQEGRGKKAPSSPTPNTNPPRR